MVLYLQYVAKALNCEQIFLQAGLASTPCCNVQKEEADGDLTLANIDCNRGCQFPLRIGKGAQETDRGNSRRIKSVMCVWGGVEGVIPLPPTMFSEVQESGSKNPPPNEKYLSTPLHEGVLLLPHQAYNSKQHPDVL